MGKCYPSWRCRPVCGVCPPCTPPDPPDAWPPFSPPSLAELGIPGYRGGPWGCPAFTARCSRRTLRGAPPPARPYRRCGAGGRLPAGAVAFPACPGGAELPAEVPGAQTKQREAAGGELQGWVCGAGAGWEPRGGVCARGDSLCGSPSIPASPARCQPCPLHAHPGEWRRAGLGRGEGQVSGQTPARPGAAWSRDARPLWKGCVRGAGWLRWPCWAGGLAGWPLLAPRVPGGGSHSDCLEHG